MKKIIASTVIAAAALLAVGCTSKKQEVAQEQAPKSLVLYYSQTGTTKAVAEEIQRQTGADIAAIELTEPYDGDFGQTIARVQQDNADSVLPTLKPLEVNIDDYDIVYLGYPIWFGTYAPPVTALLAEQKFESKTIVPFCTFGSGGLEVSVKDLKAALPKAKVADGYGVRTIRLYAMPEELDRFLKTGGYIEGEVEDLPGFSEQQPVGEAEKAIFDMACGDYQFPLGNPVSFGKRTIGDRTEYEFTVDNQTTIYVTESIVEGDMVTVEFTKVVR